MGAMPYGTAAPAYAAPYGGFPGGFPFNPYTTDASKFDKYQKKAIGYLGTQISGLGGLVQTQYDNQVTLLRQQAANEKEMVKQEINARREAQKMAVTRDFNQKSLALTMSENQQSFGIARSVAAQQDMMQQQKLQYEFMKGAPAAFGPLGMSMPPLSSASFVPTPFGVPTGVPTVPA